MFPELAASTGAELIETYVDMGQEAIRKIANDSLTEGIQMAPTSIKVADIL